MSRTMISLGWNERQNCHAGEKEMRDRESDMSRLPSFLTSLRRRKQERSFRHGQHSTLTRTESADRSASQSMDNSPRRRVRPEVYTSGILIRCA